MDKLGGWDETDSVVRTGESIRGKEVFSYICLCADSQLYLTPGVISPVTHEASSQSCRGSRRWQGRTRPRYRTSLRHKHTWWGESVTLQLKEEFRRSLNFPSGFYLQRRRANEYKWPSLKLTSCDPADQASSPADQTNRTQRSSTSLWSLSRKPPSLSPPSDPYLRVHHCSLRERKLEHVQSANADRSVSILSWCGVSVWIMVSKRHQVRLNKGNSGKTEKAEVSGRKPAAPTWGGNCVLADLSSVIWVFLRCSGGSLTFIDSCCC